MLTCGYFVDRNARCQAPLDAFVLLPGRGVVHKIPLCARHLAAVKLQLACGGPQGHLEVIGQC